MEVQQEVARNPELRPLSNLSAYWELPIASTRKRLIAERNLFQHEEYGGCHVWNLVYRVDEFYVHFRLRAHRPYGSLGLIPATAVASSFRLP